MLINHYCKFFLFQILYAADIDIIGYHHLEVYYDGEKAFGPVFKTYHGFLPDYIKIVAIKVTLEFKLLEHSQPTFPLFYTNLKAENDLNGGLELSWKCKTFSSNPPKNWASLSLDDTDWPEPVKVEQINQKEAWMACVCNGQCHECYCRWKKIIPKFLIGREPQTIQTSKNKLNHYYEDDQVKGNPMLKRKTNAKNRTAVIVVIIVLIVIVGAILGAVMYYYKIKVVIQNKSQNATRLRMRGKQHANK